MEFIDPFFKVLGWDVHNACGYAEAYKDVVHEEALKIGGATKAPDSCFRVGGVRKFFVECKKPSVNIRDAPHPAYQLRRYGWSAKLPLSILTDFEEFAVYDCRIKPNRTDSASVGRILYLTCDQYSEKWEEIASVFSREAILKGAFDKYAEGTAGKRGTTTVDHAFLEEIERWRDLLARNVAMRNPDLSQRELNFAVQRTIDRIVFLRICEDRGIETYGRLLALRNGERIYPRLCEIFQRADERYNSGLFHFQREKGRPEAPDELSLSLNLDDKILKDIFGNLYYPESPYEFSVLSSDILGQVYERFLGKVIRLTAGHQAKVEEKPEVRKAGGVFYTPDFITKTIVRHTIGPLVANKTPRQVAKLRFCDMACGSGSFLIEAFQFLLDWHRDYYINDGPEKHAKLLFRSGQDWRLTTDERKRVLLNNIFGVDIDDQAVEVSKLSLLLKVLEGESQETLAKQFELFRQRALPDLGGNIKCGNSLIAPDELIARQLPLLGEEERYRVNAFDWAQGFPEVMQAGGFDGIIGNPPYIRIQTLKEWAPVEVELYKTLYDSASAGNYDIYVVFVEKALKLLGKNGRLGFILPHKFFNAQYGRPLRGMIAGGNHLAEVVHFGDQQVFVGATTYTCLMFLDKAGADACHYVKVDDLSLWRTELLKMEEESKPIEAPPGGVHDSGAMYRVKKTKPMPGGVEGDVPAKDITDSEWNFAVGKAAKAFVTLDKWPVTLADIAERMAQGIRTSANEVYVLDLIGESGNTIIAYSKILNREVKLERKAVSLFLQGREIKAYRILPSVKVVIVPYTIKENRILLLSEKEMSDRFPLLFAYLRENKDYLSSREKGRFKGNEWYQYGRQQNIELMFLQKILIPDIADRAAFSFDEQGVYSFTSGYGITLKKDVRESPKYILGLLNSSLLDGYLKQISTPMRGGFFRYFSQFIGRLPIRRIDFDKPSDRAEYDKIVTLVDALLDMNATLSLAKSPRDKEALERQIHSARRQIDVTVATLYDVRIEA